MRYDGGVSFHCDIALTEGGDDEILVVHRADCPDVRKLADMGRPVVTMLGCTNPPPPELPRHSCLDEVASFGRSPS